MQKRQLDQKPGRQQKRLADIPDKELVTMARNHDEAAVRELIRRLNPRLFRIIRGIVESSALAEELVQETYLSAFTRLDDFRGESQFSTWIASIGINISRMHLRKHKDLEEYNTVAERELSPGAVLPFPGQGSDYPESLSGRAQFRQLLEGAISALPSEFRLPFLMHEVEGMSVRDIASQLKINPVTVKTRLYRARKKLRKSLERQVQGGFDKVFPFEGARCASMADRVVKNLRVEGILVEL